MSSTGVLLIDEGDLPSLVGLALERDPQQVVLWHPHGSDDAAQRRLAAVQEHGKAFSVQRVVVAQGAGAVAGESSSSAAAMAQSVRLLSAAAAAIRFNCPRMVWPVQIGSNSSRICQTVQRANLVVALAEIGAQKNSLMIGVPLIDLGETQIVDLAIDQGVLGVAFWPCETGTQDMPCGTCAECRRWSAGFDGRGQPWPWAAEAMAAG
ncbi:MAG: 7-cyano-7-deazaguanine synthase [Phycisphaerales bacterium]